MSVGTLTTDGTETHWLTGTAITFELGNEAIKTDGTESGTFDH
jgi:hypothetical protein